MYYSFTAPDNKSDKKYFLPKKNIAITGIVQITEQANKSPHIVISLKLPLKIASPTGKVRMLSEFVMINGHIKLFQVVTKVKMVKVTTAGSARGKPILKKV